MYLTQQHATMKPNDVDKSYFQNYFIIVRATFMGMFGQLFVEWFFCFVLGQHSWKVYKRCILTEYECPVNGVKAYHTLPETPRHDIWVFPDTAQET